MSVTRIHITHNEYGCSSRGGADETMIVFADMEFSNDNNNRTQQQQKYVDRILS